MKDGFHQSSAFQDSAPSQSPASLQTPVSAKDNPENFVARMSHEIRTPLNVVMGLVNILQAPNIPAHKQKEFLKTLQTSTQHLSELIENLLRSIQPQESAIDLGNINLDVADRKGPVFEQEDKKSARILLVEDFEPNALVATSYLKLFGYSCDVASNGREAMAMLDKASYAAVLMDVQMPEMDGYEATMFIREQEAIRGSRRIPIIGMTAYAQAGDREKCLMSGMDNYISKPFHAEELKSALKLYTSLQLPASN